MNQENECQIVPTRNLRKNSGHQSLAYISLRVNSPSHGIFSNLDWHAIGIEDSSHGKENEFSIIGFYVSIFGRSATASLTWRSKEETHVFSLTSGKTPER
jgi:hypothetical protein